MTDSENSVPQDDSEEDIYKDFAEFNFEDELAKLEGSKETYKQEALNLSERVKKLTEENEELKKLNEVLKKNLSTLLKTAQAEVQRKDSVINELRTKVDSFTFRRSKSTKDKYTNTESLEIVSGKNKVSAKENQKSKSFENRTSSDSECRSIEGGTVWKEENSGCDTSRRLNYYRAKNHCEGSHETWSKRSRESQGSRYKGKGDGDSRRHFRHNHQDHLKYDSPDEKRRSGDCRFPAKDRRNSREGRSEKRDEVAERRRGRKNSGQVRSRSREGSSGTKGPSVNRQRSADRTKGRSGSRPSDHESVRSKNEGRGEENRRLNENREKGEKKERIQKKEKTEKKKSGNGGDVFETKSPLDALYSEVVAARGPRPIISGATRPGSELEEGECPEPETSDSQPEDWALSFKNERPSVAKPLTLYSRRMMQKFSKETERLKENQEKASKETETEKEPGELTDDENEVESSKEFQELTKVAAREDSHLFKEPLKKEAKTRREPEKKKEEPAETPEGPKQIGDVIEFSPFKNNYKLIEISPVKPEATENVLDFYSKLPPPNAQTQKEVESSILNLLSSMVPNQTSEGGKTKVDANPEAPKEEKREVEEEQKEKKESRKKSEEDLGRGKRREVLKKVVEVRSSKRKRGESEGEEGGDGKKKQKLEESKKKRNENDSKSEPETGNPDLDKIKDDISFFEFFKPLTEEKTGKEISPVADFKMSLTGVVCLETPDKRVEQMIYHVVDSKSTPFSPLVDPKCVDMTPRRMLKNDLMLTDSEDEAAAKSEEKEEEEEGGESEGNSECDSDSGASDFVDLL